MADPSYFKKPERTSEHRCAGGVIVRIIDTTILVALLQEDNHHQYVLPKGHIEPGEDSVTAAIREIGEEAGLTQLRYITFLGTRERLNYKQTSWKITEYHLFLTTQQTGQSTDKNHLYQLHWFHLNRLPEMFWQEQKELIISNRSLIQQLAVHYKDH